MPIFVDFQSSITDELLKESAPLDSDAALFFGNILTSRSKKGLEPENYFRLAAEAGNPKASVALGLRLQERGKSFEAITWLRQGEVTDSWYSSVLLARALAATGSQQEAEEVLDSALAATTYDPNNPLHAKFAFEFYYAGFVKKAIQNFELAYRRSEGTGQFIAWLHILAGEEDKAMRWINDAREKGLDVLADMLEGDCFHAKGMYKDAIRSYSKVTSLKTIDEKLTDFDVLVGLRIATTYKAWGNSKEADRWTSEESGCVDGASAFVFSQIWHTDGWNLSKLLDDDVSKRITDLNLGPKSTNAMCNWGISDFRFGRVDDAVVKLQNALNAPDGTSESEASFFLMHAYAELGRIEDSAEMKRRCDASGGYEPSEIDRKRLGME